MSNAAPFDHTDTPLPPFYFLRKYGVSRCTFWRYRVAGLPAITVGAKAFVRESDFVAFLQRMDGQTVPSILPGKKREETNHKPPPTYAEKLEQMIQEQPE